ncbi:MAG: TadE-like protein [Actinomycetota bacterium]
MKKRSGSSRGSAIIEFALCLPFLVILCLGTIDGTRLYATWNRTKHAAQQGANYAQFYPLRIVSGSGCSDPANVTARVHNEGSDLSVEVFYSGTLTTATCMELDRNSPIQPGQTVSVRVTAPFTFITPFAKNLWGNPTVRATAKITVQG